MMKRVTYSLIVFSIVVLTGCSEFHVIKPENPSIVQIETTPLPLTVGVRIVNQRLTGGFSDMGPSFAGRLTNSNLFKTVLYPVRGDDKLDLVIAATFEGRFVPDGALFPKAFFTGFLLWLPAPLIEYEHHFKASGTLQVTTQDGQQLKSYEATSDIPVTMKIRASGIEVQNEGVKAATEDLIAQLISLLQKDKGFLNGARAEATKLP